MWKYEARGPTGKAWPVQDCAGTIALEIRQMTRKQGLQQRGRAAPAGGSAGRCELIFAMRSGIDPTNRNSGAAGSRKENPLSIKNDFCEALSSHSGRRQTTWAVRLKFAGLAVVMLFAAVQARAANADGSIGGLKAKFVDVNGIRTRYYEAGRGEPMVLIHAEEGFIGHASANYFVKNIPGLARQYHVFALDRLGSGMTDNPKSDKDYNIHAEMDHIVQFIQTLKLGKVNLVGHSHGAGIAMFIAVEHPEIIRTLTILDSVTAAPLGPGIPAAENPVLKCPREVEFDYWECRLKALSNKPEANWNDEFWEAAKYMTELPKSKEAEAKVKAGAGERSGTTPADSPFNNYKRALLARVQSDPTALPFPVLIIWGHDEHSVPLARGLALYDLIAAQNAKVRMVIVNRADHFDFRLYPDEYNSYIMNFIDYWDHQPANSGN
jgi:2-hydroxy-6-oxonona-2,4-dienedioate hydrolase